MPAATTPTPGRDDLLNILHEDGDPILHDFDLAAIAARAAATELACNWAAALIDGCELSNLIEDVEEVIDNLRLWRDAVQALTATTTT